MWSDLMSLGMIFPIAIAMGFFIGRWAGGLLGVPKLGMALGLVWGVATGFWELYKVTVRLNRSDLSEGGSGPGPGQGPAGPDQGPAGPDQGPPGPGQGPTGPGTTGTGTGEAGRKDDRKDQDDRGGG